ncbi:MAG: hypothetical protein AUI14_03705 [Actinobacteria bacterium 13_2_20CM_2_71_6]|nr:MAG: hypothetical protein AUI14_03705 [Actinobacteria bacterium 13_2_20CM_2_71_6]
MILTTLGTVAVAATAGILMIRSGQTGPVGAAGPVTLASDDPAPVPSSPAADPTDSPSPAATPSSPVPTAAHPKPSAKSGGNAEFEAQVLVLVNQERAKAGCAPVTPDPRLTTAARGHSTDMARRDYFDHNTPEGDSAAKRITDAGYRWRTYGENIAAGYGDPASVMKGWMNSSGHRHNILDCAFRNLGVGLAYNDKHYSYWTQDFGTAA